MKKIEFKDDKCVLKKKLRLCTTSDFNFHDRFSDEFRVDFSSAKIYRHLWFSSYERLIKKRNFWQTKRRDQVENI